MFANTQNIGTIECYIDTKNFCPLGNDWYTNHFTITFAPKGNLVDYLDIQKEIDEKVKNKHMIIEDAVAKVFEIFKKIDVDNLTVVSYVDDAAHFPVKVTK